jgi:hydrogenase expression/formation protein HypD
MDYIEAFRDPAAAAALRSRLPALARAAAKRRGQVRIMEVCGTHTMAIARHGIRNILPPEIRLISGPGCPVCVTDAGYIDAAIDLASRGVVIATFGDMLDVPGSTSTLANARSAGASVHVCYAPTGAAELAAKHPDREVVFLGIGFETTIVPVLGLLDVLVHNRIRNVSVLTAFKLVPPAMEALLRDPGIRIDAFLCPAHVSAIIGAQAYDPISAAHKVPCVVAGFEPLDILLGISAILEQLAAGAPGVANCYRRVVRREGNRRALDAIAKHLQPADVPWRGLGVIPGSGMALRSEWAMYDASLRHKITVKPGVCNPACRCGEVLKGMILPTECRLFGAGCVPEHPVGPCMVSIEGTCAAYYKYGSGNAP